MSLSHLSRLPLAAAALCAALALSACGGSDHSSDAGTPPTSGTPTTPPVATDTFFDTVLARAKSLIDNEEPPSTDAVIETRPETTEPSPVT